MIIESSTNYAYKIRHCSKFRFETVMNYAHDFISDLSKEQVDNLFDELEHGTAILSTEPQMNMYLYSYGRMHQAKLNLAFEKMGNIGYIKGEQIVYDICVVDYACGQGLATIVLADYLRKNGIRNGVKRIILVEPSKKCLLRAAWHVKTAFPLAEIITINKGLDEIMLEDIACDNKVKLHLMSNIIDMDVFDLNEFVEMLNSDPTCFQKFICVSPYFGLDYKDERMDDFCELLDAYLERSVIFEKGSWKNNWTANIRVLNSLFKPKEDEWYEIRRETFVPKEKITMINKIAIKERTSKDTGERFPAMIFHLKNGKQRAYILSLFSRLDYDDEVDPRSVNVVELSNGKKTIYRLDGEKL